MLSTSNPVDVEAIAKASDMSLREVYAGIALWGLTSAMASNDNRGNRTNVWKPDHVADKAVQLADELVKRLAR